MERESAVHGPEETPPWRGLGLVPSRRRTPLKRYIVRVILREDNDTAFLVVRARSKKNARWFAFETYRIVAVEAVECLGRAREGSTEENIEVPLCIWLYSGYCHFIEAVPRRYVQYVREVIRYREKEYVSFPREAEHQAPLTLRVCDIQRLEEVK